MDQRKPFLYKVYENEVFVGVWDDVISELQYTQEINTAGSSVTVTLARNSDSKDTSVTSLLDSDGNPILDSNDREILSSDESKPKVGPGSDVNYNNRVDIYSFYGSTENILDSDDLDILDSDDNPIESTVVNPNGIRKFTGFISDINTQYGDTETTEVTLMSYGFDLDQYLLTKGGLTTAEFNSYDPSDIVKESLDQFAIDGGGDTFTTYNSASIENTGTTVSYTYRANTYLEMAKKAIELAPPNWYWYVNLGNNLFHYHERPTSPSHTFILGQHIKTLNLRSSIEQSKNDLLFTGGGDPSLFRRYTRTPATYTRRGLLKLSDSRVEVTDSADLIADSRLDAQNVIQYKSTITILDRVYNIEEIVLGQLVGFSNFGNYVDDLQMQIVGLSYEPDAVTLQLDTLSPTISKRLQDLQRNLQVQESSNVPSSPTVV